MNFPQPEDEEIAKLAYRFYEEEGRPDGRADDHWQRALEILRVAAADASIRKASEKPAAPSKKPLRSAGRIDTQLRARAKLKGRS